MAFERAERESDPKRRAALLTFVIIGAGPTGVELAGTIAELAQHTLPPDFRNVDTRKARVVLIDRLGFGFSDLPSRPLSIAEYADATLQVLDALDIDQFDAQDGDSIGAHAASLAGWRRQFHGNNSPSRLIGCRLAMRSITSARYASGSRPLSLALSSTV